MATNPATQIAASKIDTTDPAYPYGKAQDILAPGDGKGTPRLAFLINDIFGFQQAMLKEASPEIVPSGTPDKVGASQYLEALINIIVQNGGGSVPDATTTVKGILELINQTEMNANADSTRAITVDKLVAWEGLPSNLGTVGSKQFFGGFVLNWGSLAFAGNTTTDITLDTAYTVAHHWAGVSMYVHGADIDVNPGADPLSLTQIRVRNDSTSAITLRWFSVGEI